MLPDRKTVVGITGVETYFIICISPYRNDFVHISKLEQLKN